MCSKAFTAGELYLTVSNCTSFYVAVYCCKTCFCFFWGVNCVFVWGGVNCHTCYGYFILKGIIYCLAEFAFIRKSLSTPSVASPGLVSPGAGTPIFPEKKLTTFFSHHPPSVCLSVLQSHPYNSLLKN